MNKTTALNQPKKVSMQKKELASILVKTFLYLFLIVNAVIMIFPFIWMISTSLKSENLVMVMPPKLIPDPIVWTNYLDLKRLFPFDRLFLNSLFAAVMTTIGQIVTASMAAYAFARIRFKGREALFMIYLATLMVPGAMLVTPRFILMRYLGWINTYQGLILPGIFTAFGTFLLRQAFLSLPQELEDAAVMDGASPFIIYWKIFLPLIKPSLGTLGLFAFMQSWNDYLWPLFIARVPNLMTLPVGLASLHGQYSTDWNLVMAGSVIAIVPILIVFLFTQRFYVSGVVMSGIKR
jgi:multiple sugar transport system permease protein